MDTKFDAIPEAAGARIVYVRPVELDDLPEDIRLQAQGLPRLYALHRPDGERLALVRDRQTAFLIARQNDLAAVNVH